MYLVCERWFRLCPMPRLARQKAPRCNFAASQTVNCVACDPMHPGAQASKRTGLPEMALKQTKYKKFNPFLKEVTPHPPPKPRTTTSKLTRAMCMVACLARHHSAALYLHENADPVSLSSSLVYSCAALIGPVRVPSPLPDPLPSSIAHFLPFWIHILCTHKKYWSCRCLAKESSRSRR